MINDIRINIAYSEILVYAQDGKILYPNSNVAEYDIHPWHTAKFDKIGEIEEELGITFPYTLQSTDSQQLREYLCKFYSQNFEGLMDNTYGNFSIYSLDEIYQTDKNFVYPIVLYNNDLFFKYYTINLDNKVVECVRNKRAKVCILQATEGFFGQNDNDYMWVSNLASKYGFDKEDIVVITSNFQTTDIYPKLLELGHIKDNFTIHPYSYFQHSLWFHEGGQLLKEETKEMMRGTFNWFLNNNKINKKDYHFLCFNRVTKPHRLAIFSELMINEKLKDKSIKSLGGCVNKFPMEFFNILNAHLSDDYKYNKKRLLEFYFNYDASKHYVYDEDDLENNKAANLNKIAHSRTFVNIVTESLIDDRSIFYSEKTYKPMYTCQPFIMFGNPNSLSKLRELGFKTFDKWWDESYDLETNFTRRFEKIVEVMEEIASWDMDKCYQVTQEMEEVLIHNFNNMIDNHEVIKLFKVLENKKIPNRLL
jgi:hypothetical protein